MYKRQDKGVSPVVSMLAEDSDANFAAVRDENFVLANTGVSRTEISASAGTDEAPYIDVYKRQSYTWYGKIFGFCEECIGRKSEFELESFYI